VLDSLRKCWKVGKLSPLEQLCAIVLLNDPWTPENKCLTATNKLSRHGIIAKHEELLENLKAFGRDANVDSYDVYVVLEGQVVKPYIRMMEIFFDQS
ncbi:hypothetical protein Pmar_PMAR007998, partial [Perkinsus marinus ATCC 50983]